MSVDNIKVALIAFIAGSMISSAVRLNMKVDEAIDTLKLIDKHQRIIINRLEREG